MLAPHRSRIALALLAAPLLPCAAALAQDPVVYLLGIDATNGKRVIERRRASGAKLGQVVAPGLLQDNGPKKFGVGPDGLVYVCGVTSGPGTWRFDPLTGNALGRVTTAAGFDIAFNANGTRMFIVVNDGVTTIDVATGAELGTTGFWAYAIARGPDGSIYGVSSDQTGAFIDRYDPITGNYLGFVVHESPTATQHGLTFGDLDFAPNGDAYVARRLDFTSPLLKRYSSQTWAPLGAAQLVVSNFAIAAPNLLLRPSSHWPLQEHSQLDANTLPDGAAQASWTHAWMGSIEEVEVERDADCNANGVADSQDVASGTSTDCNGNGRPDECDIAFGSSLDLDGNLLPDECAVLASNIATASIAAQGAQPLALSSGSVHAGQLYLLVGSTSGTTPPLAIDGLALPLAFDTYTAFTVANPNKPPLSGSLGVLDASGGAQATVQVPLGTSASLAGLHLWHAGIVIALAPTPHAVATSNAVELALVP